MTDLDRAPSSIRDGSICESSLHPNKSSGDIGELKPCPFCHSEGHTLLRGFRYADTYPNEKEDAVACPTCEARAPLKAWNTRTPDRESAAEIERLRREVEEANRFWNERCVQTSVNAHGWMQAHDQLLGFIQSRPDLLKVMMAEKFEIKYPAPADTPTLLQRALAAESSLHRVRAETVEVLAPLMGIVNNIAWCHDIEGLTREREKVNNAIRSLTKTGEIDSGATKTVQPSIAEGESTDEREAAH